MESRFTVNGRRLVAMREQVETALRDVPPDRVCVHAVEIGGKLYPVRQALAVACGLNRMDCFPQVASRVFRQLGFKVFATAQRPRPRGTVAGLRKALPHRSPEIGPQDMQVLELPPMVLWWSRWECWEDVTEHGVAILDLPLRKPGVYEAKLRGSEERLSIGKASDLRTRVLHGLVRGTSSHPSGRKIRDREDLRHVLVRWALTDRPSAAQEELHRLHLATFARLPKHTGHT